MDNKISKEEHDDYYTSTRFDFLKKPKKKENITSQEQLNTYSISQNNQKEKNIKLNMPKNSQFYNSNSSPFEKNIKDSNKAIYEEPIPNFDGYMGRAQIYDKILYSEEVNKKVKIQNYVQSKVDGGANIEHEKIKHDLINKMNPDLSVNINKYMEDDMLKIKRKAIFNLLKNYLNSIKENKEKNQKKKVYKIRKRNQGMPNKIDIKNENVAPNNITSDIGLDSGLDSSLGKDYKDLEKMSLISYRKSLLIRLYGFYLGNLVFEKVFSRVN